MNGNSYRENGSQPVPADPAEILIYLWPAKWSFRLENENGQTSRIFNSEGTYKVRAVHCTNLAMPKRMERPHMHRSDVISAWPVTRPGSIVMGV